MSTNRAKSLIQNRPCYTMLCMKQTSEILITDTDYLVLFSFFFFFFFFFGGGGGHVAQSAARLTQMPKVSSLIPGPATYFRFSLR